MPCNAGKGIPASPRRTSRVHAPMQLRQRPRTIEPTSCGRHLPRTGNPSAPSLTRDPTSLQIDPFGHMPPQPHRTVSSDWPDGRWRARNRSMRAADVSPCACPARVSLKGFEARMVVCRRPCWTCHPAIATLCRCVVPCAIASRSPPAGNGNHLMFSNRPIEKPVAHLFVSPGLHVYRG